MSPIIVFYAAIVLVCGGWFLALLWVISMREAFREDKPQSIPRRESYIICGKGYYREDSITMTRAITLRQGGLYVHISGQVYKCLRNTSDGCAVIMEINTGELLTVCNVCAYQDGKIDYQIVESVRMAGAAV